MNEPEAVREGHDGPDPRQLEEAALRAMSVKISRLRSFLAVADRSGFGAAANAVHLSQSRVSAHIAALESALGVSLFRRKGRPATLTREGEIFRAHAEHALEVPHEGVAAVREAHERQQHRIVVASYPSVSSVFLPSVLSILREERPDVAVELAEGTSAAALETALTSGAVDVAFRPFQPPLHGGGFNSVVLWREAVVAVMRADDPLASQQTISVADLEGKALIGNPSGSVEDGGGFDQPATIVALVRAAFGIGVISQLALVTVSLDGLAVRPIDSPIAYRDVGLHWREDRDGDVALTAFVESVGKATVPHGVLAVQRRVT